jgi:hypothetical protein
MWYESAFIATRAKAARRRAGTAASGCSQMGILGLCGLRTTSRARQMTSRSPTEARSLSPREARGLRGRGGERPSPTVSPRRARLIAGNVGRRRMLQTLSFLQCNSQHLHSSESDRALIKPSNLPMAMRRKGKKVQADYDNFLLRL